MVYGLWSVVWRSRVFIFTIAPHWFTIIRWGFCIPKGLIMYSIHLKSYINIAPRKLIKVWRNPNALLKYSKNINKIKVIKKDGMKIFTSWEVEVDGARLNWRQLDVIDLKNNLVFFSAQNGDFKKYFGNWRVAKTPSGRTALTLDVDIDWGLPVLEPYVKKALKRRTSLLFRGFLKSIKKVAEEYES